MGTEFIHTQISSISLSQQVTHSTTLTMANIILQLSQHCNTCTHRHLMEETFFPRDGITTCIRSSRSNKRLSQLFIQRRTLARNVYHKITICNNLLL